MPSKRQITKPSVICPSKHADYMCHNIRATIIHFHTRFGGVDAKLPSGVDFLRADYLENSFFRHASGCRCVVIPVTSNAPLTRPPTTNTPKAAQFVCGTIGVNAEGTQLPFAPAYCGNCWPICFVTYGDNVGVVANTEEIADTLAVDEVTVHGWLVLRHSGVYFQSCWMPVMI